MPRSQWRALPGMLGSAILGVVAALALSARAETREPTPPVVDETPPPATPPRARLAASDQQWLDRFENELAGMTRSQLVIEAELAAELLARAEALEPLFAEALEPDTLAQLGRIQTHLLRLRVWREPVR